MSKADIEEIDRKFDRLKEASEKAAKLAAMKETGDYFWNKAMVRAGDELTEALADLGFFAKERSANK